MQSGNPSINLPELESVRRLRESREGGPGSGPQGGRKSGWKAAMNKARRDEANLHSGAGRLGRKSAPSTDREKADEKKQGKRWGPKETNKPLSGMLDYDPETGKREAGPSTCPQCGGPLNKMRECPNCMETEEAAEGGPGSGPRKTQYAEHGGSPNNPNINPKSRSAKNEKAMRDEQGKTKVYVGKRYGMYIKPGKGRRELGTKDFQK